MDHKARCGMTSRGGLASASPSQKRISSAILGGETGAFLRGFISLPASCEITGEVLAQGADSLFPGSFAYADDPVGQFIAGGKLLLDPITGGGLTKVLEFDNAGGTGGGGGGPTDAADVTYDGTFPTVEAALNALLYVNPSITSFSNNVGTVEIGQTVTAVTLSWSFNKAMVSASINQGVGNVLGLTTKALTGLSLTTNTSWTLSANDGTNGVSAGTSVSFLNKRYWGVTTDTTLDDSDILALSSEFASSRAKSISYNATGGKYPVYVYPASFGAPANVTVGGLSFTDFTATTQNFTNAHGHTESFYVVRFNNLQTGAAINVVWN